MRCKRQGCPNELGVPLIRRGQVYCSVDCAPLGRYGMGESASVHSKAERHTRWREEISNLVDQGMSVGEMAEALGLTRQTVRSRAVRLGVALFKG